MTTVIENTKIEQVEIQLETQFENNSKKDNQNGKKINDIEDYAEKVEEKTRKINERAKKKQQQQPADDAKLPAIKIFPGKIHDQVDAAQQVLINKNPGIYQRSGKLVRIVTEKTKPNKTKLKKIKDSEGNDKDSIVRSEDALVIAEVNHIHLSEVLGKMATWWRLDERKGGWVPKDCPEKVSKTLIERKEWELPVLAGIIQAPTLRADGSILETSGYDEETGLLFNPGQTIFQPIPQFPSKDNAIASLKILCDLLSGFPFENDESKSVALSAILTGLVRKAIRTAPLHGFTAPIKRTGKSLLADTVGLISTGKANCAISQAPDETEEQKRLLAVLMEGDPIVCYDNIERPFGSAALCSVLTQMYYKGRILGKTGNIGVPTNATFLATGNNLVFVGDISARTILCSLDPKCERPEEREFDIDLKEYILQHRMVIVQAALTILRAYHIAGRPRQNIKQFGGFEDWSNFVRSALVWVDMEDPCASRKEIENADPVRQSLGNLLVTWHDYLNELSFSLKQAISKATNQQEESEKAITFLNVLSEMAPDKEGGINTRSLGKKLASFKGRVEKGYRFEKTGTYQGVDTWQVTKITEKNKG